MDDTLEELQDLASQATNRLLSGASMRHSDESLQTGAPAPGEAAPQPGAARADARPAADNRKVSFVDDSGHGQQAPPAPDGLSETGAPGGGSMANGGRRAWLVMKRLNMVQYDWRCIEVDPVERCFRNKIPMLPGSSEAGKPQAMTVCEKSFRQQKEPYTARESDRDDRFLHGCCRWVCCKRVTVWHASRG